MTLSKYHFLLITSVVLATSACNTQKASTSPADNSSANVAAADTNAASSSNPSDPVQSAMSAAPQSIAHDASVVVASSDGTMKTLREGKNGWTCMPDSPTTPGPDPDVHGCECMKVGDGVDRTISRLPPTQSG